jgi:hypothetical protein
MNQEYRVPDCSESFLKSRFVCIKHWNMLSDKLRNKIIAQYIKEPIYVICPSDIYTKLRIEEAIDCTVVRE